MTKSTDANTAKLYSRPELKVFGSVRNLTGGSSGSMQDGTGINTLQSRFFPEGRVN